ncbi:MAG: alpha/beta hydrolase [Aeromicrobium sp.]|uniref:alpha/beta hydrolase n=1 Tax=Aeromicrobium sp. TaxID=1871063 RepID=UPI0025C65115|nr:alpha/beta hydrolase [Aeromicrobium sp.]MCK5892689.1 alpha/beta hydrolase [Aeromicrobium sp.]MDF1703650.1 alpha/beta hydrolase [Aeromicrobium sp.]
MSSSRTEAEGLAARWLEPPAHDAVAGVPVVELNPAGGPQRQGLLLHLHGGAFAFGSAQDTTSAMLCHLTGLRTFSVDYPLAPEHPFPEPLKAVDDVLDEMLDGDVPIVVSGVSAGGNLLLGAMLRRAAEGRTQPAAAVLYSPLVDARLVGDSHRGNRRRDPVLASRSQLRMTRRLYAKGHDLTDPRLSPVLGPAAGPVAPTLLVSGTRDLLLSDCVRLYWHLRAAESDVHLRLWEGMWHTFTSEPRLPEAQQAQQCVVEFLTRHLDGTP